jgi:dTDP-glucose 4,6-dehydratase
MRILVTGCLGFIGSRFCEHVLLSDRNRDISVVGLARSSNQKNLLRIDDILDDPRFTLHYTDMEDGQLADAFQDVDYVVNFAAKTFVDYSIRDPQPFVRSNIGGTFEMLEEARRSKTLKMFVQISTDEVYGAILQGSYKEDARLNPTNPYAATKAAADMLALSYHNTYGLPIIITRTENNYGPYQGREKAVPTFVRKALSGEPLPVFGDGKHRRMWLHVEDHCSAVLHLFQKGMPGQIYHVAGEHELENIELAELILRLTETPRTPDSIKFIPDHDARPGHDRRYALNCEKIRVTGWKPKWGIEDGFRNVVDWYMENRWWFM